MKPTSLRLITPALAAIILSACATQNPAPVINGTTSNTGMFTPTSTTAAPTNTTTPSYPTSNTDNPYGAVPYNPNNSAYPVITDSTTVNDSATTTTTSVYTPTNHTAPYTPPSATSHSTYVGNYSPVDVNATYHRVVHGDTVYNISKRYGISQDQLRSWNGLTDNTISVGQNLRIKPQGTTHQQSSATPYTTNASGTHRVVQGDTVYNISKRYGISQDQLRSLNNLLGNNIKIGQVLRISSNTSSHNNTPVTTTAAAPHPVTNTQPITTNTTTAPIASNNTFPFGNIIWQTPISNGKLIKSFTTTDRNIKISGSHGQPIIAAADGQVIFSGPGPRGYGDLVVIQHTPKYLSAYGNSQNITVKEMQNVKRGQTLAYLGSSPLMFEVRQDGKPIDPTAFMKF